MVVVPGAAERSAFSLRVIRERLTELTRRQNAFVSLWLAKPVADPAISTQTIVENAVRVVRGFGVLHEIHLRADQLDSLNACATLRAPVHVEVALIALLRSEEHTSELQSLMRSSYAVFCLKKKKLCHDRTYLILRSTDCT